MANEIEQVEIDVVADAAAATRSSKLVADELARVVQNVGALETKLRNILTGKLPKEMEQLAGYIRQIQTVQGLPANIRAPNRVASVLASGGPAAQLDRAAFQGALSNLRNDKALQALQYEKEANKVLAARAEIYKRIREALPDDASPMQRTNAYRKGLAAVGVSAGDDRQGFNARTLAEVRKFENDRIAIATETANKLKAIEAATQADLQRQRETALARYELAEAKRENRLRDMAQRRRFDAIYQDAQAENRERDRQAARDAKVMAAPSRESRARAGIQGVQDRFAVDGGAGMFGVQATVLRNYAAMGAVLGSLSYATKSTTDFQAAMKDVQAISSATNTEMKSLNTTVLKLGLNSKQSVKDIAEGAKILAQAGYSVQQIDQMIKPIADLATGSGSSLADAAAVTTSVLSVFDLSVSRTAEVTNTLVAGLNQSKLSMEQLSLGIQYAGNIAATEGVQFEELVSALGAMANAGIKSGSTLGTGFRAMIEALENPTDKLTEGLQKLQLTEADVDIKTRGLANVLKTLRDAGFENSEAIGAMEVRARAAYTALANNLNVYQDLEKGIVGTTAATDAAATQMESFNAQWQRLLNSVTMVTTVMGGPVLGTLTALTGGLATALGAATPLAPALQLVAAALAAIAVVSLGRFLLGLAAGFTGARLSAMLFQIEVFKAAVATEGLSFAIKGLVASTGIGLLVVAITALITVLGAAAAKQAELNAELDRSKAAVNTAGAEVDEYQQRVRELDKYIENLTNRHVSLSENMAAAGVEATRAQERFGAWGLTLDAQGKHVDGLIGKLIQLRAEMAAVANQKAREQDVELRKQETVLGNAAIGQASDLRKKAAYLLKGNNGLNAAERAALESVANGDVTLQNLNRTRSLISGAQSRMGESGRRYNGLLSLIDPLASTQSQRIQTAGQRRQVQETLATTNVASSAEGIQAANSITGMLTSWRKIQYDINQIKDPQARNARQMEFDRQKASEFPVLQRQMLELSSRLAKDPEVRAGLQRRAELNGTDLQYEIDNQFDYGRLKTMVGQPDAMNEGALSDSAKLLEEQALTAKKAGNLQEYKAKRDKAKALRTQAAYVKFMKTGEDASSIEGRVSDIGGAFDEQTTRGMMGGGASGNRSAKREAEAEVKRLERLIEVEKLNADLSTGGTSSAAKIEELVKQWEAAKRRGIAAGGGDTGEQLEALVEEAKEFRAKVVGGTIQDAKDYMAAAASRAADKVSAESAARVAGGADLQDAMDNTLAAYNTAIQKAIEAADQKILAQGGDTTSDAAAEERRKIIEEGLGNVFGALNAQLEAALQATQRQIEAAQLLDNRELAKLDAQSNFYGQLGVGDVHRYMGERRRRELGEGDAIRSRDAALRNKSAADLTVLELQSAIDKRGITSGELVDQLEAAREKARQLGLEYERANNYVVSLTAKTEAFASLTEAASAAWTAYMEQSGVSRPVFEQFADGATTVIESTRAGFKGLFTDIATGSMSAGGAFKKFTLSVLDSMMSLAADMLANQAIKMVLGLFMNSLGGGGAGSFFSSAATAGPGFDFRAMQGGEVPFKRYVGGGQVAPFRDSVPDLLQPGEVVMRKSAVDFLGLDELLKLNTMGNRRTSQMPTMQSAQREPDTVNVWVVPPESKPPLGRKDIVAAITEDMATGGKTKQLIKAIQVGAV